MKELVAIVFFTLISFTVNSQIFVKHDATGDNSGTSWENAYIDLHQAIINAQEGDHIWIARGTYKPAIVNTPADSNFFLIDKRLELYGGFLGDEAIVNDRDWDNNKTILSGDINGDDLDDLLTLNKTDNTVHVLLVAASGAIVDGLHIKYGAGRMSEIPPEFDSTHPWFGGGIRCRGYSATFRNCVIEQNVARYAGGLYAGYLDTIEIYNCKFKNNYAQVFAGGLNLGNVSAKIRDCEFTGNQTFDGPGGGIFAWQNTFGDTDSNRIEVRNTIFSNNDAGGGGGISFNNFNTGSQLIVDSCSFSSNTADDGSGIRVWNSNPSNSMARASIDVFVSNSDFKNNSAQLAGAGIGTFSVGEELNVNIDNCLFEENETFTNGLGLGGAAISNLEFNEAQRLTYRITNNTFLKNISAGCGGAVWNSSLSYDAGPLGVIENCWFRENECNFGGGAVSSFADIGEIRNCLFEGNLANGNGGAIEVYYPFAMDIQNSEFRYNVSNGKGSAVAVESNLFPTRLEGVLFSENFGSSAIYATDLVTLINGTVVNNDVGLGLDPFGTLTLQNTIFNNLENFEDQGNVTIVSNGGNLSSDNTLTEYLTGSGDFEDINNTDPMLDMNFFPLSDSPCIDAGNPNGIATNYDLAGNDRIQGSGIDIGAYESSFTTSLAEHEDQSILSVYPNPFWERATLEVADVSSIERLELLDSKGTVVEVIYDGKIDKRGFGAFAIQGYGKLPGLYMIRVSDRDGTDHYLKVIKVDVK